MSHATHPNFFRLFYDEAQPLRNALTQAQCQKLLGAMAMYFLFHDEPHGLPRQAQALFESHRARLDRYRNSAINGGKNSPNNERNSHAKTDAKTYGDFLALAELLPAETPNLGTYPETDPEGLLGGGVGYPQKETGNSKHKTPPSPAS